jgi:hypothetical protein
MGELRYLSESEATKTTQVKEEREEEEEEEEEVEEGKKILGYWRFHTGGHNSLGGHR